MAISKLKPVCIFLLLCTFFFILGRGVLTMPRLPLLFGSEAVFSKVQFTKRNLNLFSALPLSLKSPSAPAAPAPAKTPQPPTGQTDFAVYHPDAATSGDTLQIQNSSGYSFSADALLSASFPLQSNAPKVLIVHTHTSEAYAQSEGYTYTASDTFRTEDPAFNICRVGQELAKGLQENGIETIHDTTSHDYPSYSGCYGRSLETIEKNLALHPTIDIVIDLHRDAISDENGQYLKTAAEIDGKLCAQALVIVGTDAGGLPHSTWEQNLSLGLKVQKNLCEMYPGLSRPLHLRAERFNGHASPGALLIEIGSNGNTMEEALYCARLVANALAKTITDLLP